MELKTVVVLILLADLTAGCGITTHTEIGHRAAHYYKGKFGLFDVRKIIQFHQPAFQAGNPYPDSYFDGLCKGGKYHWVSEDTHWAPFLKTAVQYIRDTYPHPWGDPAHKLIVFLLGFASHQVADVLWHSLGIDQGFLTTMGDINFFGSFPDAHFIGDAGSDVLSRAELDLNYISALSDWYVPVKDLYEIYKIYYNGTEILDKETITECTSLLFLARLGEAIVMAKLYREYSSKSPFMVEEFESYFLGGVNDMALQTGMMWHKTLHMLEHGTSSCTVPNNPIYINCSSESAPSLQGSDLQSRWDTSQRGLRRKLNLHGLNMSDIVVTETERGVHLSPSESVQAKLKSLGRTTKKPTSEGKKSGAEEPASVLHVKNDYALLGRSLTTGNVIGDLEEDLIIGAPGYGLEGWPERGKVYIIEGTRNIQKFLGNSSTIDLDADAEFTLEGLRGGGWFGHAVAILDINLDGYMDVAVSAPHVGFRELTYEGKVYIYYGSAGGKLSKAPNITISCTMEKCTLGWSLASGDFNLDGHLDLLIGSPFAPVNDLKQAGMVSVLYAGENFQVKQVNLTEKDMNYTLSGDQEFGWFGHRVSLRTKPGLDPLLLISQPTYRICAFPDCSFSVKDVQSVGSLIVYKGGSYSSPALVLKGQNSFDKLGAAMAIGDPFGNGSVALAVAADTQDVKGRIAEIPTTFSQAGQVTLSLVNSDVSKHRPYPDFRGNSLESGYHDSSISLDFVAKYEGDRRYGRFGREVVFGDVTGDGIDDLLVAAPFRTVDITEEILRVEEGAVYVYQGGPSFHVGDVTNQCRLLAGVKPCPQDKAFAVLSNEEPGSRFGSMMTVWRFDGKTHLVVSAPRSDATRRLGGAVYIYTL